MKNQHVVPHSSGGWAIVREGGNRATWVFANKQEATKRAKEIAQNNKSELLIHNRNGQIHERNSYVILKEASKNRK